MKHNPFWDFAVFAFIFAVWGPWVAFWVCLVFAVGIWLFYQPGQDPILVLAGHTDRKFEEVYREINRRYDALKPESTDWL